MNKKDDNGMILLINKPMHWTSNDVIRKIKAKYRVKKAGHAGTLDPLASGLLVVATNRATKQINEIIGKNKTYLAHIVFNYETTTYDNEGMVTYYKYANICINNILDVLEKWKNQGYEQIPPLYSAIKVNGKKAYALARKNIEFELKSRKVDLLEYKIISLQNNELKIEIDVSKGFYVRSFARDLGRAINNYATLTKLVRTRVGEYELKSAYEINDLGSIMN